MVERPEVYVGIFDREEVDFVTIDGAEYTYYQVALTVRDEQTLRRELRPFQKLPGSYPKFLLTLDDDPELSHEGIRQVNALDFLLQA